MITCWIPKSAPTTQSQIQGATGATRRIMSKEREAPQTAIRKSEPATKLPAESPRSYGRKQRQRGNTNKTWKSQENCTHAHEHSNTPRSSGAIWPGLVRSGLVWCGLAWPGTVWSGLASALPCSPLLPRTRSFRPACPPLPPAPPAHSQLTRAHTDRDRLCPRPPTRLLAYQSFHNSVRFFHRTADQNPIKRARRPLQAGAATTRRPRVTH